MKGSFGFPSIRGQDCTGYTRLWSVCGVNSRGIVVPNVTDKHECLVNTISPFCMLFLLLSLSLSVSLHLGMYGNGMLERKSAYEFRMPRCDSVSGLRLVSMRVEVV